MTNKELIAKLLEMPEEVEVMISAPYFFGPIDSVYGDSDEITICCDTNLA